MLHWGGRGGFGGFCLLLEGEEGVGWFEGFTLFGTSNNFKRFIIFFFSGCTSVKFVNAVGIRNNAGLFVITGCIITCISPVVCVLLCP